VTLEQRIRHAYLMEYLMVRRLRAEARVATAKANRPLGEGDGMRGYYMVGAQRATGLADGAMDVIYRMRDVARNGGY